MGKKDLRGEIVSIISSFIHENGLDYRETWRHIYTEYEEENNLPVLTWYKFGSKDKLSFLEDYEELYGTMTKLYNLIKPLK